MKNTDTKKENKKVDSPFVDRDFTWLDMEITDLDKVVWKGHHISYEDVFTELRDNDYYEIETILDTIRKRNKIIAKFKLGMYISR